MEGAQLCGGSSFSNVMDASKVEGECSRGPLVAVAENCRFFLKIHVDKKCNGEGIPCVSHENLHNAFIFRNLCGVYVQE